MQTTHAAAHFEALSAASLANINTQFQAKEIVDPADGRPSPAAGTAARRLGQRLSS